MNAHHLLTSTATLFAAFILGGDLAHAAMDRRTMRLKVDAWEIERKPVVTAAER